MDDLIQTKTISRTPTTNMLYKNITVDDKSQDFETPRKHNHSATAPSTHVSLGYDKLQFQHNITNHMKLQKIPPSGKEYICLKNGRRTDRSTQCSKSRALTKFIDTIISIE